MKAVLTREKNLPEMLPILAATYSSIDIRAIYAIKNIINGISRL